MTVHPDPGSSLGPMPRQTEFALIIAGLIGLAPMTIDMYLPAFPALQQHFRADAGQIQMTLGTFFYGLAFGQLLYGPLSDLYGRRGPLLIGLGLHAVASLGCILAPGIEALLALRLLQALGVGATVVIARAVVRDFFEGARAAQVYSLQMSVTSLAPMIAPILGGALLTLSGWQSIFVALAGLSSLGALLVLWRLPPLRIGRGGKVNVAAMVRPYLPLLRDGNFLSNAVAGGSAMAVMYAFIGTSPFIFVSQYGLGSLAYAWLFALMAFGLTAGSFLNGWLVRRFAPARISQAASLLQLVVAASLLAASLVSGGHVLITVPFLLLLLAPIGLITPNTTALALRHQREHAGSASALIGTIQFLGAALVNTAIGWIGVQTDSGLAALAVLCSLLALLLQSGRRG